MESVTSNSQHPSLLRQPWRLFYRIYYYLLVLPLGFLFLTPFLAFWTYLFSFFSSRLAVYMGVIWAKGILWLARIRVRVFGIQHVDPKQSYVIVVNHESNLDILAIYGYLPVDFRWVMKIEIRKFPIIGPSCARMKHIYVDRSDHQKAIESLQNARTQLVNGTSILFFPEGTRSKTREMLPFKKGAFRMAIDLDLPLLPVTLRNTGLLMPARSLEAQPGALEMMIHQPISVQGLTEDDVVALLEKTRSIISAGRDTLTPEIPVEPQP